MISRTISLTVFILLTTITLISFIFYYRFSFNFEVHLNQQYSLIFLLPFHFLFQFLYYLGGIIIVGLYSFNHKSVPLPRQYLYRLQTIDRLIRIKGTGPPQALARRLKISVSRLYAYIAFMKEQGAPIRYCKYRGTYYYEYEGGFDFKFRAEGGGVNFLKKFLRSCIIGVWGCKVATA